MMTVLHVIDTGGPGGAETVFLQTATRLEPKRFRSVAVVSHTGWLSARLRERGLEPSIVPAHGSFNVRYLGALLKIARQSRADVIVAHLYGSAVYAGMVGMILPVPVVSVLHGQTDLSSSGRLASLKSAIVRTGSRKVVFVSERLKDYLGPCLRLAASRGVVIPNGVDTSLFQQSRDTSLRAELALADDTVLVGSIGNVRPPKSYDVLLRCARILLGGSRRYHFAIAGDYGGRLGEELLALSRNLGVDRHVSFLGLRHDVSRILNNMDIFALSSTTEGFSIACIEAMACGIPVVATRSGGPEQILRDGAGVLVPVGDPRALAGAIEQVASSRDLAADLTATATRRVFEEYSLTRMLSRYEDLLTSVAHRG